MEKEKEEKKEKGKREKYSKREKLTKRKEKERDGKKGRETSGESWRQKCSYRSTIGEELLLTEQTETDKSR